MKALHDEGKKGTRFPKYYIQLCRKHNIQHAVFPLIKYRWLGGYLS